MMIVHTTQTYRRRITYPREMVDVTERDGKCPIIKLR